jgi:transcriptional regulator with XRE-family HTH domain
VPFLDFHCRQIENSVVLAIFDFKNTKEVLVYNKKKSKNILVFGLAIFMSIFARRLKEARKNTDLSQERLGVLAGIDEMSASARMNQYERGKHEPEFTMVERIAKILNVPEAYFYAKDDELAWLLVTYHRLSLMGRNEIVEAAKRVVIQRGVSSTNG